MRPFFLLIIAIASFTLTGAVSDSERLQVKSGEKVTLSVGNVRRVMLKKCENRTEEPIIRYCSPEEEKNGCTVKKSDRFRFDTESLSVTFADARASDEGCYIVSYIDVDNILKEKFFEVAVHGSLETLEDFPIKTKETPLTISLDYLIIIAVSITLSTPVVILVIIYVINYIINCQKKNQNTADAGDGAEDPEIIPLSSTRAASEAIDDA